MSAAPDRVRLRAFAVGPLASTAVVLLAGDDAVIVDPGDEAERLLDAVVGASARVREVWLTHAHFDHVGGLQDLLDALPAPVPVRLHPDDRPLYEGAAEWAAWAGVPFRAPTAQTTELRDGERLEVGAIRATALHTPGHAPGHVAFALPDLGTVLAGDALFRGSVGRTDLPYADGDRLLRSVRERLLTLPDATRVIPGHGAPTTIGEERRSNPFLTGPGPGGTPPSR